MSKYKLLACDVDNTLIRSPNPPSPRVVRAVQAARDAGVIVVLASGRAYPRIAEAVRAFELTGYVISNQGAAVRRAEDGTQIRRVLLTPDMAREIVAWGQGREMRMFVFGDPDIWLNFPPDEAYRDFQVYSQDEHARYVTDLLPHLPAQVESIMFSGVTPEQTTEWARQLEKTFGERAVVMHNHSYCVDVLDLEATKAHSLAWLADREGIASEEVIAIGDGKNDVLMFQWAGLSVALGDGHPTALAAADVIAPPFDEDGAAWAIERYVLGEAE